MMSYEDLSSYTEVDPNEDIIVYTAGDPQGDQHETCHIRNFSRGQTAYLVKDFGAGYFGDVCIEFEWATTNPETEYIWWIPFGLADDLGAVDDLTGYEILIRVGTGASSTEMTLRLLQYLDGVEDAVADDTFSFQNRRHYWCRLMRSGSTVTLEIYSDPHRETLLSRLTLTGATGKGFRYLYACQSRSSGSSTRQMNGYSEFYEIIPITANLKAKFEVNVP